MSSMEILPNELLLQIISHCDGPGVRALAGTNRKLRSAAGPQLYHTFSIIFDSPHTINKLNALQNPESPVSLAAAHTKFLIIRVCPFVNIPQYYKNPACKKIIGRWAHTSNAALQKHMEETLPVAFSRFRNLEKVKLLDVAVKQAAVQIPLEDWLIKTIRNGLEKMSLKSVHLVISVWREVPIWVSNQRNLEDITVSAPGHNYDIKDNWAPSFIEAMSALFGYPSHLKRLSLDIPLEPGTENPSEPNLSQVGLPGSNDDGDPNTATEKLFDLEELAINASRFSPAFLKRIAPNIRNLTRLTICNPGNTDPAVWTALKDSGARLKYIEAERLYSMQLRDYINSYSGLVELTTSPGFIRGGPPPFVLYGTMLEFMMALRRHKETLKVLEINTSITAGWDFSEEVSDELIQLSELESYCVSATTKSIRPLLQISAQVPKLQTLKIGLHIGFHPCGNGMMGAVTSLKTEFYRAIRRYIIPEHSPVEEILVGWGGDQRYIRVGDAFLLVGDKYPAGILDTADFDELDDNDW